MAVKCNIPNLALDSVHALMYGFSCKDATTKIVQNYIEYLKCSGVDYSFCEDYPCIAPSGDTFCSIEDILLEEDESTINSVTVSFTIPTQPYSVRIVRVSDDVTVETKLNPTSPTTFNGLTAETDYNVQLILMCEGGEVKTVNLPVTTVPTCVEIEDFTATPSDVNEYE